MIQSNLPSRQTQSARTGTDTCCPDQARMVKQNQNQGVATAVLKSGNRSRPEVDVVRIFRNWDNSDFLHIEMRVSL